MKKHRDNGAAVQRKGIDKESIVLVVYNILVSRTGKMMALKESEMGEGWLYWFIIEYKKIFTIKTRSYLYFTFYIEQTKLTPKELNSSICVWIFRLTLITTKYQLMMCFKPMGNTFIFIIIYLFIYCMKKQSGTNST